MELRRLRYFLAVAEAGHITRAAERLGLQQPPLSQQIRALEAELGVTLFVRHPKGVTLSAAGHELLAEARRVLQGVEQLEQRMRLVAAGRRGVLSVGFTTSAAAHAFTPTVLRACRSEFPDIELRISENNAAELVEALQEHRIDFGFLRVPVARPEGLVLETQLVEPTVLVLPIDHPLARSHAPGRAVPLEALAGESVILVRRPGAPGLYANFLARLAERGVEVRVVAEVERMLSNINLVASGTGISIVPASMQGSHPQSVVYRPLPRSVDLDAPITLAYRQELGSVAADRFLGLVRRTARQFRRARARARTRA